MGQILSLGIILITSISALIYKQSFFVNQNLQPVSIIPLTNNITKEEILEPQIPELSIEQIFSTNHNFLENQSKDKVITLIATGDVIPARVVNISALNRNNFLWPYEQTADVLINADITFINLETPLIKNCPIINSGFKFCGDSRHIEGLKFAGVDVASLANNHSGNFGIMGINETRELLKRADIQVTGISGPAYKEVKGIKFAFLGYNDIGASPQGISAAEEEKIKAEITEAKQQSDFVIVTYHWGTEYRSQPDERQVYLGHLTIDSGADLVIGNHPHWIQPVEFYQGKLITYAHGNFIFDQEWSQKTKEGVIGRYTFYVFDEVEKARFCEHELKLSLNECEAGPYDKKLVDVEYLPIIIENYGQARFLEGDKKQRILDQMKQESIKLSSNQ